MGSTSTIEILLVEDNTGDVFFTWETLKETSVRSSVNVAADGVEALSFLRRQGKYSGAPRPDLVLLDLNMPRKGGFEVLVEMKEDPDLRTIPVIIMSSSQAEEDVLRAYDLQASCYVAKPGDLNKMVAMIQGISAFWLNLVNLPPRRGASGLSDLE